MNRIKTDPEEIFDVFSESWYQSAIPAKLEALSNMSGWRDANGAYSKFRDNLEDKFDLGSAVMALSLILQKLLSGYHPDFSYPASRQEMEDLFRNIADDAGEITRGQKKKWDSYKKEQGFSSNELFYSTSKEGTLARQNGSRYKIFTLALENGFTVPEMALFHFLDFAGQQPHILDVIPQNLLELIYYYIEEKSGD